MRTAVFSTDDTIVLLRDARRTQGGVNLVRLRGTAAAIGRTMPEHRTSRGPRASPCAPRWRPAASTPTPLVMPIFPARLPRPARTCSKCRRTAAR